MSHRHEWDASTYHRVSAPQVEWGRRVLARLSVAGDELVVDVGCGTGRLTAELAARLPRGRLLAIDRSSQMLATAREHLGTRPWAGPRPKIWFVRATALDLPVSGCADIIFSTATFHWVPDHPRLFRQLAAALKPGGRLHAQCGGGPNLARLHARARRLMDEMPYAPFFRNWKAPWEFADAGTTARRLKEAGFEDVETSTEPAPVVLGGEEEFAEFVRAVILHDHLAYLPEELRGPFVAAMTAQAATDDPPFSLDYWRLNLAGRRL